MRYAYEVTTRRDGQRVSIHYYRSRATAARMGPRLVASECADRYTVRRVERVAGMVLSAAN